MSHAILPAPDRPVARTIALAVAIVLPSVLTWLYFVRLTAAPALVQQLVYATGKTLQFALPAVVVWLVLRRSIRPRPPSRRGVGEGLVSGLVLAAAAAILYPLLTRLEPDLMSDLAAQVTAKVSGLGIASGGRFLAVAIFYSLVHSALEEYYWRWFVFGNLRDVIPLPAAHAIAALGFTLHHIVITAQFFPIGWALFFSFSVGVGGLFWSLLFQRQGTLAGAWASHAVVDAALMIIGYQLLAVSG